MGLDLGNVDPRVIQMITGVGWGAGALIAACAIRVGAPGIAEILRALLCRGKRGE